MTLQEIRKEKQLTQKDAALLIGIPLRTYARYENDSNYLNTFKYRMIVEDLLSKTTIDEEHGILSIDEIKSVVCPILKEYNISYCVLFGSYARGEARENSDVDLLVETKITGFEFFGLVDRIRDGLNKKVDLLRLGDLEMGNPIILEILKEGVRIV